MMTTESVDFDGVDASTYIQSHATKIVGNGRQESVLTYDGLLAHIVEHETSGPIRVLGPSRRKAILANEGSGLVTKTAGNPGPHEWARRKLTVGRWVRARHDLG